MTDISEAERLALITHAQVDLVNEQAELVETALEGRPLIIDWSTGQRAVFTDNVIPFPQPKRRRSK